MREDSYGRYCPISMASDVLADRWTPLIVRELVLGNTRFNDIARGLPGISRSLLVKRLKHLERSRVLDRWPASTGQGSEYHLTPAGKDLFDVLMALGRWSVEWQYDELRFEDVDMVTLTWWMHRRVDRDALPPGRVVVEFVHTTPHRQSIWVVLEHAGASVCKQHPGFPTDVTVTASTAALAEVFGGRDTWSAALRDGRIDAQGRREYVRALRRWFLPSPFAEIVAERAQRLPA